MHIMHRSAWQFPIFREQGGKSAHLSRYETNLCVKISKGDSSGTNADADKNLRTQFQHYPHDLAQTVPTATLLCSCTHGPALEVGALPETEELRVRAWFTNKSWTGIKQNLHTQGRKTVPSITGSLNHQPGFTTHQVKPKRKKLQPKFCFLSFASCILSQQTPSGCTFKFFYVQ